MHLSTILCPLVALSVGCTNTTSNGGADGSVPAQALACDALGPIGQWENITPAGVGITQDFVLDPINVGTVYVGGGLGFGILKTTNCGATWTHVNTGLHGMDIDQGGHWTLAIDQTDPQVLYTGNGYGPSGVFKSTNGGVDWAQVLTPEAAKAFIYGGFIERITVDPTDHLHVLVSPHFSCENGHTNCLLESPDGGVTWKILDGAPGSGEDSGQIMIDSKLWFFANPWSDGLWRTDDAGATWKSVRGYGATDSMYIGDDGRFFTTSLTEGILESKDRGVTWAALPDSPHVRAVVGDGTTLYASNRNESSTPFQPYQAASEADPSQWKTYPSPDLPRGGWVLHYDRLHNLLYSSTENNGFWRVRTK